MEIHYEFPIEMGNSSTNGGALITIFDYQGISTDLNPQGSQSSMGVQASPTYYLPFWLGSPLPNHIQPWLIAHFLLIKSLFQLSLSFLEFLIFRFAEKNQHFFCLGQLPRCFSHIPFFLLVKNAMVSGELHPLGPRGPTEVTSRDSTAVPPRGSTSDWRARRATPRGTSNGTNGDRCGWGPPVGQAQMLGFIHGLVQNLRETIGFEHQRG
jgi:hypothetical protein